VKLPRVGQVKERPFTNTTCRSGTRSVGHLRQGVQNRFGLVLVETRSAYETGTFKVGGWMDWEALPGVAKGGLKFLRETVAGFGMGGRGEKDRAGRPKVGGVVRLATPRRTTNETTTPLLKKKERTDAKAPGFDHCQQKLGWFDP